MRLAPVAAVLALVAAACASRPPAPEPVTLVAPPILRPPEPARDGEFAFQGALTQGGFAIGQAPPGALAVTLDGVARPLAIDGRFLVGFGRDAPLTARVEARLADGARVTQTLRIASRAYRVETIPGLARPSRTDPAYEARRSREVATIRAARATPSPLTHWAERFAWPVTGRISGVYGSQRILGGVPGSAHAGVDIARPAGTPVRAPAGGVVTLASPPRFSLEGEMVFIDHGHGLVSSLMHLSRVDVVLGQRVTQGQVIGAVGATGRATGPHLHWGLTLAETRLDPALAAGPMPAALT